LLIEVAFRMSQRRIQPMDEPTPSRKLTAILAADVAGYSRMMRADQSGTVTRLAACRSIFDEAVALHQGRIANTAGDSVLAEFSSVVDALHCAIEIQTALTSENETLPSESRMQFRIGVHTGDVFVRHGDLLGDGVNVAARLQSLAPPGGVYASETVREQVRGMLTLRFDDRGPHHLKNIARSVRVYAVAAAGPVRLRRPTRRRTIASVSVVGAALALILVIGSAGALWWLRPPWLAPWLPDAATVSAQKPTAVIVPRPRSTSAPPVAPPQTAAKPAAAPASPTNATDATELAVWQSATAQGSQTAIEEYLRQYPAGRFAELARTQIQALKSGPLSSAKPASPSTPDQVAAALAQGVPFDCPKPGTVIGFSDGRRLTFGSRSGFHCHALDDAGKTADEYAGFISFSAPRSLAAADLERLWPLKEHAEVVFATNSPELFSGALTQPWASNRYRVVGTEHLHLQAGDFDTVIVERHLQGRNAYNVLDVTQKLWYAPKIALVVKFVTERGSSMYAGTTFPDHVEATEVTVP
jgi:adenylate cyclase